VARAVLDAVTSPRPRDRYFVGRGVGIAHRALRLLPAGVLDAAVRAYLSGPRSRGSRPGGSRR
jgi:hypothetical protein